MSHDAFAERAMSFEEGYFRNKDAELVDKLKAVFQSRLDKEELRKATGITNEEVLDRLVAVSAKGEMLSAFKLFPLVEIAWADGIVEKKESEAIINAAVKMGMPRHGEAIKRLEEWLVRGPSEEGRAAWYMFAQELRKTLSPDQLSTFRTDLLKYANDVAHASGGFLGIISSISHNEQKVIDGVKRALSHT